jgi:hypothetical protein
VRDGTAVKSAVDQEGLGLGFWRRMTFKWGILACDLVGVTRANAHD